MKGAPVATPLTKEDKRYLEGKLSLPQYYRILKGDQTESKKSAKRGESSKGHTKR